MVISSNWGIIMDKKKILSLISLIGAVNMLTPSVFASSNDGNLAIQKLENESEDWENIEFQVMRSLCRKDYRELARELLYFTRCDDGETVKLQCKMLKGMPEFPVFEIKSGEITSDLCKTIAKTFMKNVISYRLTNMKLLEKSPFLKLSPSILSNEKICTLAEKLINKWKKDNVYNDKLEVMVDSYGLNETIEALYEKFLENEKKENTLKTGQIISSSIDKMINETIEDIVNRLNICKDGNEWLFSYEVVLTFIGNYPPLRYNNVQIEKNLDKETLVNVLTSIVIDVLDKCRNENPGYVFPVLPSVDTGIHIVKDDLKLINNWEKEGVYRYKVSKMVEPYAEKVMKKYEEHLKNLVSSNGKNSPKMRDSIRLNKKLKQTEINDKIENSVFNWIKQYCEKVFKGEDKLITRRIGGGIHEYDERRLSWHFCCVALHGFFNSLFDFDVKSYGWRERSKEDMEKDFNKFIDWIVDYLSVCVQLKRVGITKLIEMPDLSDEMLFLEEVLDKWKIENVFENKKSEIIDELFKIYKSTNIN